MNRCALAGFVAVVLAWTVPGTALTAAPLACSELRTARLVGGSILSTEDVGVGGFVPPPDVTIAPDALKAAPGFCRVTATLAPSPDSDIRVEVWLPTGWNGKFQAVGNGGLGGVLPYAAMLTALRAGYATAGTDTGHVGSNADFVRGHPEKLRDFGYRAIHELTVAAKALIAARYGSRPARSYFDACSTGGRQGLIEAHRYPEDFDGIVAGASAWDQMRLYAVRIALNLFVNRDPESTIPASKYPMVHAAVLNACDVLDGVKDGVLEDPTRCHFDYAALTCTGVDGPNCLTRGQVESARAMTSAIVDRATGKTLYAGHLYPGTELSWDAIGGVTPSAESLEGMRKIVFSPGWDYHTLRVPDDVDRAVRADAGLLFGGDPDLGAFFKRGGKLLMYHGWADPLITPDTSLTFRRNVLQAGGSSADDSTALFMIPGMGHCRGGPGTDSFDSAAVIDAWVTTGKKPQRITAGHVTNGVVDRTRPLCPYPQTAHYVGTGSTDEAINFRCEVPQ